MSTHSAHTPRGEAAGDLQDLDVGALKNAGVQTAATLRARGVRTVGDLLAVTPRRYLDLRAADDWRLVRFGEPGALVAVEGVIADVRAAGARSARRVMAVLEQPNGPGTLRAVFFHAHAGLRAMLRAGATVRLVGALREGSYGRELVQPRVFERGARLPDIDVVYPSVGSLSAGNLSRVISSALELVERWADPVPVAVAKRLGLMTSAAALRAIHSPPSTAPPEALRRLGHGQSDAHKRLGFEELLALSVAVERVRHSSGAATVFASSPEVARAVSARLSIGLTDPQYSAIEVLRGDLARATPMRRLLVGDVGSGKTAVALAASLAVLRAGGSIAWLCPTTLVAEQHAKSLERALAGEGGPIAVLLGSTPQHAKKKAYEVIAKGLVRVVVGTHALLEPGALPPRLGLAVIDEQHRFGVAQRVAMFSGRETNPHGLVISATPIPRTLAMARYGDLELLTLHGGLPGRHEIVTQVGSLADEEKLRRTIFHALAAGGRVFVVVPTIDGGDPGEARTSKTTIAQATELLKRVAAEHEVMVLHGRMRVDEQREALDAFRRGSCRLLLGTTVVEVGLDVPEANLMVVLGAEHFGLAQLHQLRGRVGRAGQRAGCLLLVGEVDGEGRARVEEIAMNHDGFALAERDFARRGGGEWFGEKQSGHDGVVRFIDPMAEPELTAQARECARQIVAKDPDLQHFTALGRAVRRIIERGALPLGEETG